MLILGHAQAEEITAPYSKDDGRTALHIAAALGNVVFVQLLLWVSIDDGRTALHIAAALGNVVFVQL